MPSPPRSQADYSKEFIRILEGFRYKHNMRELFSDWLEIAACAIHQEPYHLGLVMPDEVFHAVEAQYMEAIKRYGREELDTFAKLLGLTKMALWADDAGDFLGSIYMSLEISSDRGGEFFTPYNVSLMMAKMTLADVAEQLNEKGFITVAEPAVGGGGMLIAVAQTLREAGYNPSQAMFFEATDISRLCFNMAYLQTSILELSGIVRHGDTLRNEVWSSRFTPICRVFPHRTNMFLNSLYAPPAEETQQDIAPTPANDNKAEAAIQPGQPEPEETSVEADPPENLSDLDEDLIQGRLF